MSNRTKVLLAGIFIAALGRVVPHPPNFAPITALALFGGAYLSRRWVAFLVPLLAMLAGDCLLELATRAHVYGAADWLAGSHGFYRTMWTTYLAFVLVVAIGCWLGSRGGLLRIGIATFASSLTFFIVTNFALWALETTNYPHTWGGLIVCYIAGLPFFGNTLASDAMFVTIFFGGLVLLERAKERGREHSTAPATVN